MPVTPVATHLLHPPLLVIQPQAAMHTLLLLYLPPLTTVTILLLLQLQAQGTQEPTRILLNNLPILCTRVQVATHLLSPLLHLGIQAILAILQLLLPQQGTHNLLGILLLLLHLHLCTQEVVATHQLPKLQPHHMGMVHLLEDLPSVVIMLLDQDSLVHQ